MSSGSFWNLVPDCGIPWTQAHGYSAETWARVVSPAGSTIAIGAAGAPPPAGIAMRMGVVA